MKLFFRLTVLTALVLLVAISASAQTTASLAGTVTTDGAPLPGATVTISSPQMQGTRTSVTGEAGGYSFGAIPPGEYTVKFELAGMQAATKRVHIGVGQTGRADADLKVSAVAEAITVTAASPSVLETPTVSQNISAKLVDDLPIARTQLGAALLVPGVNDNTPSASQMSISGSPGYDNLVLVNGVAVTENVRHQALGLFIEDAIQETTVMTGAISAEYGGFTGGVVNSITKTGGNEFSGSFRDSLTNPSWRELTPGQKANNTKLLDKLGSVYEGTLGGYVMKDRLWFFLAGRDTKSDTQRSLRAVPLGDATRSSLDITTNTKERRWEAKLTGQITPKHNLSASYLNRTATTIGDVFTTTSYDLNQQSNRQDPQKLKQAHYNGVLTNNWMLEAQYSSMFYGIGWGNGSQYTDFVQGSIVRNRADGSARWNSPTFCGVCDKETRNNNGWKLATNYFLSTKGTGNHNFVGGVERLDEQRYANNYQSGSNFRVFVDSAARYNGIIYPTISSGRATGNTYLVWTPIFTLQQNHSNLATNSAFVNDRWDLNDHWSFSLGVRYDKNDAVDGTGNKVSDDSKFTPRLNATYDINGNGKHRLTASYAEYASRVGEGPGTAASSAGSPGYIYYSYLGPAINPPGTPTNQLVDTRAALAIMYDWLTHACNAAGQCGTANLDLLRPNSGHSVPGYDTRIDKTLSSPYVQELSLGYGSQWTSNLVTRIDLISRDWKDFYGFNIDSTTPQQVDPLGITHDVAIVKNTNLITRKYRGVQFQGNWRPNRFNVGLNYTYATLKGNDEQESSTSGTVGNVPGQIYYPELRNYANYLPEGYLSQDERHRVRAWAGYDLPMPRALGALNFTLLQNYDSGLPYSAVRAINLNPYKSTLLPANSKYATASLTPQYYFSKRGAYRLADIKSTDLAINYRYPISRVELFATAEVLNLFNGSAVTSVVTTVNDNASSGSTGSSFLPFNPFTDTPKECPQGTPLADCKAMGANWQKASSFGTPASSTSYQTPRNWRFQVGVRF